MARLFNKMSDKKIVISLAGLQKPQPQSAQPAEAPKAPPSTSTKISLPILQQSVAPPSSQNKIVLSFNPATAPARVETEPPIEDEDVEMEMSQPEDNQSFVDVSIEEPQHDQPLEAPAAENEATFGSQQQQVKPAMSEHKSESAPHVDTVQPIKISVGAPKSITIPVQIGQKAAAESNEHSRLSPQPLQKITIPFSQPLNSGLLTQPLPFASQIQQASPMTVMPPREPKSLMKLNLTDLYTIAHRQVSFKLVCGAQTSFKAQQVLSFQLKDEAELLAIFTQLKEENFSKASVELNFAAKHIQITGIFELDGVQKTKEFAFNSEEQEPEKQAQVHQMRYDSLMQLTDIQHKEKQFYLQEALNGSCQLKKKVFGLKLQKYTPEQLALKLRPQLRILVEYKCDQVTQGGGFRQVPFLDENRQRQCYYYTAEGNPECWLPQVVGAKRVLSPWSLRIAVPCSMMAIASGVQTQRLTTDTEALHTYELQSCSQERIGLCVCPFPKITQVQNSRVVKGTFACFQSSTKQQHFLEPFIVEAQTYMCNKLLQIADYPVQQVFFVFLPNLLTRKFTKQSISFGEGLHLLDEQIIFQPNQIDKRHHFYKQVGGAVAFDFFGSTVREELDSDMWLLTSIRERIGDRMKRQKCGFLLYKYQTMRSIERIYDQIRSGVEMYPLQPHSDSDGHMSQIVQEQLLSDVFYRKCGLLMHMMESSIQEQKLDEIFRGLYHEALQQKDGLLGQLEFRKKFKKACGMQLTIKYYVNWILATSCPEFELSYEYNKRHNQLDLKVKQTSAVAYGESELTSLAEKLHHIFPPSETRPFFGPEEPHSSLQLDKKQSAKRYFQGDINIVIYQTEGNERDIISQQVKYSLKEYKSEYSTQINLQGRVKKTLNKKTQDFSQIDQKHSQNDFGQLKLNVLEEEDYPLETKSIFENLDSNPVLWIRVDPDFEFIRLVKVNQERRNNWLYQLLRDKDIVGQIEAARRLAAYNEQFVYDFLKTVTKSQGFFYKIRKECLKTLQKIEVFTFQQFLSHEQYLIKLFDSGRVLKGDIQPVFYKENDFSDLLEYYHERQVLKAISKCKEKPLKLTQEKEKEMNAMKEQRCRQVQQTDMHEEAQPNKADAGAAPTDGDRILVPILDAKIVLRSGRRVETRKVFDESLYKTTTEGVAKMLLQVLAQNDNSSNDFDDSYYLRDLLSALGRIDNHKMMPQVAAEVYRQFKLDQISNSSTQFAVTLGAIKAYFNLQKQLFKFRSEKQLNLNMEHESNSDLDQNLEATLTKLKEMKADIDRIFVDSTQPLEIRLFIFACEVKNLLKFKAQTFSQALTQVLKIIDGFQDRGQIHFAYYALRQTVTYLEGKSFVEMDMKDAHNPETRDALLRQIWKLFKLPHAYLSHEFTFWVKRLIKKVYGNRIPALDFILPFERDGEWLRTEAEHIQLQTQLEAQKHQQTLQVQQLSMTPQPAQKQTQMAATTPQIKVTYNPQQRHSLEPPNLGAIRIPQQFQKPPAKKTGAFKIQIGLNTGDLNDYSDQVSDVSRQKTPYDQAGEDDDESEYDPFAAIVMDDPTMQKCWLVLGKLFYHYDSTDFLEPVTPDCEFYDDYIRMIRDPMDISTIRERCEVNYYINRAHGDSFYAKELFKQDVMLMFTNCRKFNERGSDIVKSSERLEDEFRSECILHDI